MSDYGSEARPAAEPDPWVARQLAEGLSKENVLAAMEQAGWSRFDAWQVIETTAGQDAPAQAAARDAPAPAPAAARGENVPLALAAAFVAALAGGLLWAGMVIVTGYDIGIVAWLVGVVTGAALVRVAGGSVPLPVGLVAGLFAAVGIVLGRYVVVVHDLKEFLAEFASQIKYTDTELMSSFLRNLDESMGAIYLLWIGIAVFSAVRIATRGHAFGPQS